MSPTYDKIEPLKCEATTWARYKMKWKSKKRKPRGSIWNEGREIILGLCFRATTHFSQKLFLGRSPEILYMLVVIFHLACVDKTYFWKIHDSLVSEELGSLILKNSLPESGCFNHNIQRSSIEKCWAHLLKNKLLKPWGLCCS